MKDLNLTKVIKKLQELGEEYAETTEDIVQKKNDLVSLIKKDEFLDIDEINNFSSSPMSISFNIIRKSGRVDKETNSRTGTVFSKLRVEFNWRKFTDGGYDTDLSVSF